MSQSGTRGVANVILGTVLIAFVRLIFRLAIVMDKELVGCMHQDRRIEVVEDMQRMDSDPFSANATSQLSSDFKSAVSTSPLEQRLHQKSRLGRTHSEFLIELI